MEKIRVVVAGATGWAGGPVTAGVLTADDMVLTGAVARAAAGRDIGAVLRLRSTEVLVVKSVTEALNAGGVDVLVDYTHPDVVKSHVLQALGRGVRVVIGTSGLTADDFTEIGRRADETGLGVIAAGNFSMTAALAKHFSLIAAQYLPSWELIDYADAAKVDAPSGSVRELADALGTIKPSELAVPISDTRGTPAARGATIGGSQVHSIRLPSFTVAFETLFGLPDERLTIRHDAGAGAAPYVAGTLLAIRQVMTLTGLVRGLDTVMFQSSV